LIGQTNKSLLSILLAGLQVTAGCSHLTKSDLASRSDYTPSLEAHYSGDPAGALGEFPGKERDGFVTTVERLWLNLLNRTPDISDAVRVGATLEERKTLRITREAKSYFYQETEDGYYPAEHEAVLLHILTGFTFAAAGQQAEAAIEARRASFYLQNEFGSSVPFDDPALRLWLGTLWLYCGDWQHARVDFRVAARLSKDYAFLATVADREQPPERVALLLTGSGPQPVWKPELRTNVAGGLQKLDFVTSYERQQWRFADKQGEMIPAGISTSPWYDRHQERDHVIRQTLDGSRYMMEAAGTATAVGAVRVVSLGVSVALITLGIVGGAGIMYYALLSGSDKAVEAGFYIGLAVAMVGAAAGIKVYKVTDKAADTVIETTLSPAEYYRFVRYLPDYVHFAVPDSAQSGRVLVTDGRKISPLYELKSNDGKTAIDLYYASGGAFSAGPTEKQKPLPVSGATEDAGNWVASTLELNFDDAVRFCERQKYRKGRHFSIPTESDVRQALAASGEKPAILANPGGGDAVWIKSAYSDTRSGCLHIDLNPLQSHMNSPCSALRRVICVGK
jgi:hypothetical protein